MSVFNNFMISETVKTAKRLAELQSERDMLLDACRGALACLASGDLTPEMALLRLRAAIAVAERT